MKKVIFTFILFVASQIAFADTYYWIGGTSFTTFSGASNWNTQLGGGGTNLSASISGTNSITHTFIIDGSDLDDEPGSQTGPMVGAFSGSINMGQLFIQNLADVTFSRPTTGTTSIVVYGLNGPDFVLDPTSKLTLTGTTGSMSIVIGSAAGTVVSGEVGGHIVLAEGTSTGTNNNRFTSRTEDALVFLPGSSMTTAAPYVIFPFSTTTSGTPSVNGGVVFQQNSHFYYYGGGSPFGSNSTSHIAKFLPGSKFHFRAPAGNTQMFSNRPYGDVYIENNATVAADGTLARVDSFIVATGATFITDSSGSTPISGHLVNNGTLIVPTTDPYRNNKLVMIGSAPQNISGTGIMTLADFYISNQSNVTLQRALQVDSSTMVIGTLNPNGNAITGTGTFTEKAPASVNVTGTTVLDSFLVKDISNLTDIVVGMSVTGAGIPANTVVTNLSTTNMTISISNRATASGSGVALTIFNGQGTILPIKFGTITANLVNGQTKITWNVLLEESIVKYAIERSLNGTQFNEVGSVNASRQSAYYFTDVTPATGINLYRIKAVGKDGEIKYSSVLKVNNAKGKAEFSAYPNPVKGGVVSVQLGNVEKGNYTLRLLNTSGQTVYTQMINHMGGSTNQTLVLPAGVKAGMYSINIIGENTNLFQQLIVE